MLAQQDLRRTFHKLIRQFSGKIHFSGSEITVNFYDHASKVLLTTPVYLGTNYIPKSVRACISKKESVSNGLRSHLTIDEDNYRILLNYNGILDRSKDEEEVFKDLIEHFASLAEEWKAVLDEHDKNDLIYIHSR